MAVTPLSLSISSTKLTCKQNLSVSLSLTLTGQSSYLRCVEVNLPSSDFTTWVMIGQTYGDPDILHAKFLMEDTR